MPESGKCALRDLECISQFEHARSSRSFAFCIIILWVAGGELCLIKVTGIEELRGARLSGKPLYVN